MKDPKPGVRLEIAETYGIPKPVRTSPARWAATDEARARDLEEQERVALADAWISRMLGS